MRVRGPLLQAQLLETALLNIINFQTLIATKASRLVLAARGEPVLEFGLRRAQGIDGALSASRAAFIGGCDATSNVLAGQLFGIPVRGTHAHSWVMCHDDELTAFREYARVMPNNCVFLVDTYDTLEGVRNAVTVGRELRQQGHEMIGIRLDSGDLAYAEHRGPADPRRRRFSQGGDRRLQRPRRADRGDAQGPGRQDQHLGRGHAAWSPAATIRPWAASTSSRPFAGRARPGNTRSSFPSRPPRSPRRASCRSAATTPPRRRPAGRRHHRRECAVRRPDDDRRSLGHDAAEDRARRRPPARTCWCPSFAAGGGFTTCPIWNRFVAAPPGNSPVFPVRSSDSSIRTSISSAWSAACTSARRGSSCRSGGSRGRQ